MAFHELDLARFYILHILKCAGPFRIASRFFREICADQFLIGCGRPAPIYVICDICGQNLRHICDIGGKGLTHRAIRPRVQLKRQHLRLNLRAS